MKFINCERKGNFNNLKHCLTSLIRHSVSLKPIAPY